MSAVVYILPQPYILSHGPSRDVPSWLADLDDDIGQKTDQDYIRERPIFYGASRREFNADDALAASGDCFVTIATRLDKLAQNLADDSVEQIEIEHIVRSLLYLQDHYAVIAKHKLGS
jgi:hypothetical protein